MHLIQPIHITINLLVQHYLATLYFVHPWLQLLVFIMPGVAHFLNDTFFYRLPIRWHLPFHLLLFSWNVIGKYTITLNNSQQLLNFSCDQLGKQLYMWVFLLIDQSVGRSVAGYFFGRNLLSLVELSYTHCWLCVKFLLNNILYM